MITAVPNTLQASSKYLWGSSVDALNRNNRHVICFLTIGYTDANQGDDRIVLHIRTVHPLFWWWEQHHQTPSFSGSCLGKAVLFPITLMAWGMHWSKVLNYLRQIQFQIVLLSEDMSDHVYQFLFQDCVSSLSSVSWFLFKKFRTPFPKVFSPKT